ncbi:Reticulon protein [Fasciola gigantica]|uniref:Reticulon-like protein n=1 Tax=Fasciola gigantica TaxID=46835 RepID=A0A504YKN3_FASGI|nr:Reticulon protein [Fasciola gigantica]
MDGRGMDCLRDLVYWREPIKSGIFMVLGLTLLISLSCLSLVSIVAYAGLALLCCTAGYRMYCFLLNSSKFGNKMDGSATIVSDPFCVHTGNDFAQSLHHVPATFRLSLCESETTYEQRVCKISANFEETSGSWTKNVVFPVV